MAQENLISVQIKATDITKILEAFKTIQDTIKPYTVALSPETRQSIPKMNDGNEPFVQKAYEYTQTNPEFVPAYLDVQEFGIDLKAVETLMQLFRPAQQLVSTLDDTLMLSGSEAYSAALAYYHVVKHAAKMNIPNAKPIYEDLKKRFEGQGKKKTTTKPTS